ncbi:MAG: sigma-70 family RNA polymerase sigma factor [Acidobacteriota bacterium]|nr:sigma-70 family RNA polymerase sigma factor [Acidobacteriota bacterium]MDH3783853.1 sigma-70 family RNA polymerase sigma factor [Acidobacteriota bacterium]
MRDEAERIRAAAAGDRDAFDQLVRAKRERVVRTAYQITGNLEDALDVAQGVFLKLWQGLDRYDPARTFDTWVYRITVNAAIDSLRSKGPKGMMHALPDEAAEILPAPEKRTADERLDLGSLQAAFRRLAATLAPKQRAAFVLREIEGRTTSDVARILDVTESTVRNHLLQARRILRRGLERDYPELIQGFGDSEDRDDRGGGS